MADPKVTAIEVHEFEYRVHDLGRGHGWSPIWEPGNVRTFTNFALRVSTDVGITGEFVSWYLTEVSTVRSFADYVIGKNALERERIYQDLKRGLRGVARIGIGPIDIALWDIAGKYHKAPIYKLLGGYRRKLPCYASALPGEHRKGGLDSPEAFAEFTQQCLEMGYPAFKVHGWEEGNVALEIETVHAVRKRVGRKMELLLDPASSYITFADALRAGRACDEEGFLWYEDPFYDGGISQFAHRKLRQLIKTPLLMGEHVRTQEPKVDFLLAEATDFVRGDPVYDGITGTMKMAHAAEGLGIDVELHMAGPAQRHCMAAMRNSNYYEMGLVHPKVSFSGPSVYKCDYRDTLDAIDRDGCVSVPEAPGLGVEYDWDYILKHRTGGTTFK